MDSVAKVIDYSRSSVPTHALLPDRHSPEPLRIYRFATGELCLRCESSSLLQRFETIFGDCRTDQVGSNAVDCHIAFSADHRWVIATFSDDQRFDLAAFIMALFSDRGVRVMPSDNRDWTWLEFSNGYVIGCRENQLIADSDTPWESVFANTAINRVLRRQSDLLFFHAAAVSIDNSASLFIGPKGSGKTTLSLFAGTAGFDVLSDEMSGVLPYTLHVYGIRRAAGIRESSLPLLPFDTASKSSPERYPDGTLRFNYKLSGLANRLSSATPELRSIFFLNSFQSTAAAHKVHNPSELVPRMLLLPVSLQSAPPGKRLLQLMNLLARTDCYLLDVGPPQETISLIHQISGANP